MECLYELTERSSPIDIVTTLLGLIGGLVTAFRLVVPRVVSIILKLTKFYKRQHQENMINPTVSSS